MIIFTKRDAGAFTLKSLNGRNSLPKSGFSVIAGYHRQLLCGNPEHNLSIAYNQPIKSNFIESILSLTNYYNLLKKKHKPCRRERKIWDLTDNYICILHYKKKTNSINNLCSSVNEKAWKDVKTSREYIIIIMWRKWRNKTAKSERRKE